MEDIILEAVLEVDLGVAMEVMEEMNIMLTIMWVTKTLEIFNVKTLKFLLKKIKLDIFDLEFNITIWLKLGKTCLWIL